MFGLNQSIDFILEGYHDGAISKYKSSDFKGKWLILVFYISDYSVLCPTELFDISNNYNKVTEIGAELLSISTDPAMSHLTWNNDLTSKQVILFPMLSDVGGTVSKAFGVYNEQTERSRRATFIIDPDAKIRSVEVSDDLVSRSFQETLRKLESLVYINKHPGMGCPADWKPGMDGVEI